MKDFQDFINRFDIDDFQTLRFKIESTGEDDFIKSFKLAMELLQCYHLWLHDDSETSE